MDFPLADLPPEPGVVFGRLLLGCIRDRYAKDDSKLGPEGVLFLAMGMISSLATTYLLSMAGVLL